MRTRIVLAVVLLAVGVGLPVARAAGPVPDLTVPAARDTEPIVLQGSAFGDWAAPAEVTVKAPAPEGALCIGGDESKCTHNQYEEPEVATGDALGEGVPVDRLIGYRWDAGTGAFVQIPFQVDELAIRYLSNNASGFSVYSWSDQHPTYVLDEERFRWTAEDPADPCRAVPRDGVVTTPDPVPGLDANDEVAFMAFDAGPAAPAGAPLPGGHRPRSGRSPSPIRPTRGSPRYVYVAARRRDRTAGPRSTPETATSATSPTRTATRSSSPSRATRTTATPTRARGSTPRPVRASPTIPASTDPRTRRGCARPATPSATRAAG